MTDDRRDRLIQEIVDIVDDNQVYLEREKRAWADEILAILDLEPKGGEADGDNDSSFADDRSLRTGVGNREGEVAEPRSEECPNCATCGWERSRYRSWNRCHYEELKDRPRILVRNVWEPVCTCDTNQNHGATFRDRCAGCGGLFQILPDQPSQEPVAATIWVWSKRDEKWLLYEKFASPESVRSKCEGIARGGLKTKVQYLAYLHPPTEGEGDDDGTQEVLEVVCRAFDEDPVHGIPDAMEFLTGEEGTPTWVPGTTTETGNQPSQEPVAWIAKGDLDMLGPAPSHLCFIRREQQHPEQVAIYLHPSTDLATLERENEDLTERAARLRGDLKYWYGRCSGLEKALKEIEELEVEPEAEDPKQVQAHQWHKMKRIAADAILQGEEEGDVR